MKDSLQPKLFLGGDVGNTGIEVGAEMDVGLDVMSAPKSLWAQKSLNVLDGWSLKTRAEYTEGKKYRDGAPGVYLSLEASDADRTCFGWASGDVSKSGASPLKFGGKKIFDTNKGKFMIEPRYRTYPGSNPKGPNVCLGYEPNDDTQVYLTASKDDQNLKVVQAINDDNTLSLKGGTADGFLFAKLESSSDMGKSTITVSPSDLDVELEQDGWKAGMRVPYPYHTSEPEVRFSKKFSVAANDILK